MAHENGSVEAAHGHLKRTIREALELRGSNDFADLAAYQAFLAETVARKNAQRAAAVAIELKALQPLPRHRTTDFSVATVTVTRFGTISLRGVLYTVPSRLIGTRLKVHIFDDRLVCHLGDHAGADAAAPISPRRRQGRPSGRLPSPDRHAREEASGFPPLRVPRDLFPRAAFRRAWEALDAKLEPRKACRVYVGLLHLAAMHGCEARSADHLEAVLDARQLARSGDRTRRRRSGADRAAHRHHPGPEPGAYDRLLAAPATPRICPMTDAAKLPLMLDRAQDADHRPSLAGDGRARRQGGLGRGPLPRRLVRARTRRAGHTPDRPPSCRVRAAAGKTLETFDFAAAPSIRKAHIAALATGDAWIEPGRQYPDLRAERAPARRMSPQRSARG